MDCHIHSWFYGSTESHIREEFDEEVRKRIIEMEDPKEPLVASKSLKESNQLYKLKAHQSPGMTKPFSIFVCLLLVVKRKRGT